MHVDDNRQILVAGFLFDPVEQRIDLVANVWLALIVDLDETEQEKPPGKIREPMFFQRM